MTRGNYIKSFHHQDNLRLPAVMDHNQTEATRDKDKASHFNSYFNSIFNESSFVLPSIIETQTIDHVISEVEVSEEEVYNALVSLNPTKAVGFEKLVLKY